MRVNALMLGLLGTLYSGYVYSGIAMILFSPARIFISADKGYLTLGGGGAGGFYRVSESSSDKRHYIYLSRSKVIVRKNKTVQITIRLLKKRTVSELKTAVEVTALSKPHVRNLGASDSRMSVNALGSVKIGVFISPLKIKHDIQTVYSPSNRVLTFFNRGNDSSDLFVASCKARNGICSRAKLLGIIEPDKKKTYTVPEQYAYVKVWQEGYEDYPPSTVVL